MLGNGLPSSQKLAVMKEDDLPAHFSYTTEEI
jgi:hypothetical protein